MRKVYFLLTQKGIKINFPIHLQTNKKQHLEAEAKRAVGAQATGEVVRVVYQRNRIANPSKTCGIAPWWLGAGFPFFPLLSFSRYPLWIILS